MAVGRGQPCDRCLGVCIHVEDEWRASTAIEVGAREEDAPVEKEDQVWKLSPIVCARNRRCPACERRVDFNLAWKISGAACREDAAVTECDGYGVPAAHRHVPQPDPHLTGGIESVRRFQSRKCVGLGSANDKQSPVGQECLVRTEDVDRCLRLMKAAVLVVPDDAAQPRCVQLIVA